MFQFEFSTKVTTPMGHGKGGTGCKKRTVLTLILFFEISLLLRIFFFGDF
jgi:hypothetical protein